MNPRILQFQEEAEKAKKIADQPLFVNFGALLLQEDKERRFKSPPQDLFIKQ